MYQYQTDVDGFKWASFHLSHGPLEPMVINFICNFYLVGNLPYCPPLLKLVSPDRISLQAIFSVFLGGGVLWGGVLWSELWSTEI